MVGAVLAGGLGRRLSPAFSSRAAPGVSKPAVSVAGHPLVSYPLAVLTAICSRVVVVCKRDTALPDFPGVERWNEPDDPRHPVTGLVHALERAGDPVLVCAADMPFVTAAACRALLAQVPEETGDRRFSSPRRGPRRPAHGASGAPPAVVATGERGHLEPLLAVYLPGALAPLRAAPVGAPLRRTVASLDPVRVRLPSDVLRSVNTPADLAEAEAGVARAGRAASRAR